MNPAKNAGQLKIFQEIQQVGDSKHLVPFWFRKLSHLEEGPEFFWCAPQCDFCVHTGRSKLNQEEKQTGVRLNTVGVKASLVFLVQGQPHLPKTIFIRY